MINPPTSQTTTDQNEDFSILDEFYANDGNGILIFETTDPEIEQLLAEVVAPYEEPG